MSEIRLPTLIRPEDLPDPFDEYMSMLKRVGIFRTSSENTTSSLKITLGKKDCLIVVDMQNDFMPVSTVNPQGGKFMVAGGHGAAIKIVELMRHFENAGALLVATRDYHPADHCSFSCRGGANPAHCVQGHIGSFFYSPIKDELDRILKEAQMDAKKREPIIVFKGFHEDVDSFSALQYSTHNFDERRRRKNPVGKLFCASSVPDHRALTMHRDIVGTSPCSLRGAWTGSFELKCSNLSKTSASFRSDPVDANAPPDVLAAIHSRRCLRTVLRSENIERVFVTGVAGDVCVLDTCLNSPVPAFWIVDATRPVYLPGVGRFGSGFASDPEVIARKLRRENVQVRLTSDLFPSSMPRESIVNRAEVFDESADSRLRFNVEPVELDLDLSVDVSSRTAKLALSSHSYLRIFSDLGFGETADTSTLAALDDETAGSLLSRHDVKETACVFVYPLRGVEKALLDTNHPHRTTLATLALVNSMFKFIVFGGWVFLDKDRKALRATTITLDVAPRDVLSRSLVLGEAIRLDARLSINSTSLHPTTIEGLRRDGYVKFSWLSPGERLVLSDEDRVGWTAPRRGAFLYLDHSGAAFVRPVLCG